MLGANGLVDNIELFFTPYSAVIKNGLRNSETVNMLRGPDWRDVDFSLGKTFWLGEWAGKDYHMEVRADAFDALNNPNFSQPSAGVGVAGGGVISSANTNRQIQLGARVSF